MGDLKDCIIALPQIETNIKDILLSYDVSKPPQANIDNLVSNNTRATLESCVTYIKSIKDQYPTIYQKIAARASRVKQGYAGDISIFINGVTQIDCESCDGKYCHTSAENTNDYDIKCYCCNRFAHKPCYDAGEMKRGLFFICSVCTKKEVKEPVKDDHSDEEEEVLVEGDQERRDKNNTTVNHEVSDETQKDKSTTICPLLVVNECPHGISGKGCAYKHPRWCYKYQTFGDSAPEGCRRGDKCWFYHPKLCENSRAMQICLNKKCKDVHIHGTHRKPPPKPAPQWDTRQEPSTIKSYNIESRQDFPHMNQNANQSKISHPNPWGSPSSSNETSNEETMNSFLEKCFAKINSQVVSTISQRVDEAVQRSLQPMKEKLFTQGLGGNPVINKVTPETSQQEDLSAILKCLKQLIPEQK